MATFTNNFYGKEISVYGIENKRVDYRTFSSSFNHVYTADALKLADDFEIVNGIADNSDTIESLESKADDLEYYASRIEDAFSDIDDYAGEARYTADEANDLTEYERVDLDADTWQISRAVDSLVEKINSAVESIRDEISCLENEQIECDREIFQYFIIDANGADIIQTYTNEMLWHSDDLDLYVWGVDHFGTSWDYVLTEIECHPEAEPKTEPQKDASWSFNLDEDGGAVNYRMMV